MAKPNYQFEKRQRELEKKKKKGSDDEGWGGGAVAEWSQALLLGDKINEKPKDSGFGPGSLKKIPIAKTRH